MTQGATVKVVPTEWVRAGGVVRAWTETDDSRLVEWTVAGHSLTRIAQALGRTASAVTQRRRIMRDRIEALRTANLAQRPAWPARGAVPVPDTARAAADIRRRLTERLAERPRGKFWTARRDLELAMAMAAGIKPAVLARDWRCESSDVQARWLVLCPDRAQAGVVSELIALLGVEVTHG